MERAESTYRLGYRPANWSSRHAIPILPTYCGSHAQSNHHDITSGSNRLIYGDNLLAMAALLAGSSDAPSMRGKIDLIYIDPPFDSKADYRTKVELKSEVFEQKPAVIEQILLRYVERWQGKLP